MRLRTIQMLNRCLFGACLLVAPSLANAISIDIVSVAGNTLTTGAKLHFHGNSTFTFDDASTGGNSGYDFIIQDIVGGTGDSFGLRGNISGTFTIGTPSGSPETATVTSSVGATLTIFDGATSFSGTIDWITLQREGTSGNLNISGLVNLTGITYTGSVQDLIDLKGQSANASATIAFTFNPAKTITQLKTEDVVTTYTGDLTSVPDGGLTIALLGCALVGVEGLRRKFAK